jgi:hypothetical protein
MGDVPSFIARVFYLLTPQFGFSSSFPDISPLDAGWTSPLETACTIIAREPLQYAPSLPYPIIILFFIVLWRQRVAARAANTRKPLYMASLRRKEESPQCSWKRNPSRRRKFGEEAKQKQRVLAEHLWQQPSECFVEFVKRVHVYFQRRRAFITNEEFRQFILRNIHPRYIEIWYLENDSLEAIIHRAQFIESFGSHHPMQEPEKIGEEVPIKEVQKESANHVEGEEKEESAKVEVEVKPISPEVWEQSERVEAKTLVQETIILEFQIFRLKAINPFAEATWIIFKVSHHHQHNQRRRNRV